MDMGDGILQEINIPMIDMDLIPEEDKAYASAEVGFWTDPHLNDDNPDFCMGKILRVNKYEGTIQVIGIDTSFNVDIPITSAQAAAGYHGDVSLPARGWHVLMARLRNGDLYPIRFIRPYDRDEGWMREVPVEMDEGDIGWTTENSRMLMFQNGMMQFEASPNCARHMHPLDGGEKIQDICKTYGLFTDAGSVEADILDDKTRASAIRIKASKDFASEPSVEVEATFGSFDKTGTTHGVSLNVLNGPSFKMSSSGETYIDSTKLTLGAENSTEPVVLGAKFLSEYTAFKTAFNAHVTKYNLHIHAVTPAFVVSPTVALDTPFAGSSDFLSSSVFSK